jgi:hypothetical protein
MPVYTVFLISSVANVLGFIVFWTAYYMVMKKIKKIPYPRTCSWNLYTNPDWQDPDQHALDADPDTAKLCGSDPIQIQNIEKNYGCELCKFFNLSSFCLTEL